MPPLLQGSKDGEPVAPACSITHSPHPERRGPGSACHCLCSQAVVCLLQPPRDVRSISATHHRRKGPVTLVLKMQNQTDRHLPSLCDPSGTQTSPLFLSPHRVVQPRVCWKTGHSDRYRTWAGHALDMGPAIASQKAPSDHCYQVLIELFPEPASYLRTADSIFFMSQISSEGRVS